MYVEICLNLIRFGNGNKYENVYYGNIILMKCCNN